MFDWINSTSEEILRRGYLLEGTEPKERIREIADTAAEYLEDPEFSDRFYEYMGEGYYSLASPVWANFGLDRGLSISCFSSYIEDSIESILHTHAEVGQMTKIGGGTAGYFGAVRPRGSKISGGGKTNGTHPFAQLFDKEIQIISQTGVRRGFFAGYQDIEHGDIDEWLNIQNEGDAIQDMMWGVVIGDDWMQAMIDGDQEKRETWAKVLEQRRNIGVPYIIFRDNANRGRPQVYKDRGEFIKASNLCSEIFEYSGPKESFVCCLSSINASKWAEIKRDTPGDCTGPVATLVQLLDAVMQDFIDQASEMPYMERAVRFARKRRAIGIGVLGWHSLLQSRMIPFDSMEAMQLNAEVFSEIQDQSYMASEELAGRFGEPEVLKGYGRRNTTTMAVAPTKSSSTILGQVSPSIEPFKSNYYVRDNAKKKLTQRNPYLKEILGEKGKDTEEVWSSIRNEDGSVQHLDFLSSHEKDVFKTFAEIPQLAIVQQAAQRQKYIDQGQSLNLTIHPKTSTKEINQLYIEAWRKGVKSLYYQHSVNAAQEFSRNLLSCNVCES